MNFCETFGADIFQNIKAKKKTHTIVVRAVIATELPMNAEMYLVRENGLRMNNRCGKWKSLFSKTTAVVRFLSTSYMLCSDLN